MKKFILSLIVLCAAIQLNAQTVRGADVIIDNTTGCPYYVQLNPLEQGPSGMCYSHPPVTIVVPPHSTYMHPGTPGVHYEVTYVMDNMTLYATIAIPIQTPTTGPSWSGFPGQPTACNTALFLQCDNSGGTTGCTGIQVNTCWDGDAANPVIVIY